MTEGKENGVTSYRAAPQSESPETPAARHTPGPWHPTKIGKAVWLVIGPDIAVDGEPDALLVAAAPELLRAAANGWHALNYALMFVPENDPLRPKMLLNLKALELARDKAEGNAPEVAGPSTERKET